jgi:hypothetical protein
VPRQDAQPGEGRAAGPVSFTTRATTISGAMPGSSGAALPKAGGRGNRHVPELARDAVEHGLLARYLRGLRPLGPVVFPATNPVLLRVYSPPNSA